MVTRRLMGDSVDLLARLTHSGRILRRDRMVGQDQVVGSTAALIARSRRWDASGQNPRGIGCDIQGSP
jgi:hypothetical protein